MLGIQPLSGRHDRRAFDSGSAQLDAWLRQMAQQHQRRGISKTFVATSDDAPSRIPGFYALRVCEVVADEMPADLARSCRAGCRASALDVWVDRSVQGQGLGELLLMDAIRRAKLVLEHVGVHALFVDAKDTQAANFYGKYGFRPLPSQRLTLVLVIAGIA